MLTPRKKQAICLILVAIVLLLIGAWASGWIPAQARYCEYNLYTEHENCTVDKIAIVGARYFGWFLNFISPAATWIATTVIGIYTIVLTCVTGRQAKLTRESIDLARQEFTSTHRPKILVYGLSFFGKPNQPIAVSFRYVNSGESTATITGVGTALVHLFKPTMPSEINFRHKDTKVDIPSGNHGLFVTEDTINPEAPSLLAALANQQKVICVGYIVYRDDNGTNRQMGFCREYDPASNRWLKMNDDEYEYSY